jgi:hypothetical protein
VCCFILFDLGSPLIFTTSERMLAQTERPADIVRRRLDQAGYDVADGLDTLGEGDLSFLMKFVYKSTVLGPTVRGLTAISTATTDNSTRKKT